MPGPTSHSYFSQRLRLHYVDWGNEDAPPLLLVHGGRDHCRNWDWVAEALRDEYHVTAPDMRGHGDSQWMVGGSYSIPEFVYDVAQLIHQAELAPLTIIGHSMGSGICLRYAGIYPDKVEKIIGIEGIGPSPRNARERATPLPHARLQGWIDETRALAGRVPRRYATLDDAITRMQEANRHLRPDQVRHLTTHGVNRNEDGTIAGSSTITSAHSLPSTSGWKKTKHSGSASPAPRCSSAAPTAGPRAPRTSASTHTSRPRNSSPWRTPATGSITISSTPSCGSPENSWQEVRGAGRPPTPSGKAERTTHLRPPGCRATPTPTALANRVRTRRLASG